MTDRRRRYKPGANDLPTHHRLPWAPLEQYLNRAYRTMVESIDPRRGERLTDVEIARIIGANRVTVRKMRMVGSVPLHLADEWACAAGTHPAAVWGHEFYAELTPQAQLDLELV